MSSHLRAELANTPIEADQVGAWLLSQFLVEQMQLQEEQDMSQAATADDVTIPIPPGSLTGNGSGEGPDFIKGAAPAAPAVADPPQPEPRQPAPPPPPPPPPPQQQPQPAPQPRAGVYDASARQLQFRIGSRVSFAIHTAGLLPESVAERIGMDLDAFERFLLGRDNSITMGQLMAVTREVGARLSLDFAPGPARQ